MLGSMYEVSMKMLGRGQRQLCSIGYFFLVRIRVVWYFLNRHYKLIEWFVKEICTYECSKIYQALLSLFLNCF